MKNIIAGTALALVVSASAHADIVGTVAASNNFALYGDMGNEIYLVGGSLNDDSGDRHDEGRARTFLFTTENYIYITTWGDEDESHGVLAQFETGSDLILTGDGSWQVFSTGNGFDDDHDGDHHGDHDSDHDGDHGDLSYPPVSFVSEQVALADSLSLWEAPEVGDYNTGGHHDDGIDGISADARWISSGFEDSYGDDDHDDDHELGQFQIFRTAAIPTPGAISLAFVGLGLSLKRRR